MKIYESGWIDLKKTIEYIARGNNLQYNGKL